MSESKRELKVFFGCEAFLCKVLGPYRCLVWLRRPGPRDHDYDEKLALEINLARTPSKDWDNAIVDDYLVGDGTVPDNQMSPGATSLGPRYPGGARGGSTGHATDAGVWLEQSFYDAAVRDGFIADWPRSGVPGYVLRILVYRDQIEGVLTFRRYAGYHAMMVAFSKDKSGAAWMLVWDADQEPGRDRGRVVEVDFHDPSQVDREHSHSFQKVGDAGALFLRWTFLNSEVLMSPKLPIGEGEAQFPNG